MPAALNVRVTGRVQGVSFRAWTADQARMLGLAGWVRNCNDGSVEMRIEGEPSPLDVLIGLLRSGPSGARVEDVQVERAEPEGLRRFEVRH